MTKAMIEHEIKMLQNKLNEIVRLDMWNRWTYEDDESLRTLKAELKKFEIK